MRSLKRSKPVIGYRVWDLERVGGYLRSLTREYTWPLRKRMERDGFNDLGIHAIKDTGNLVSLQREYGAEVAGPVYLWGEVIEHERGYRAQFAYPGELWMPEDTDPVLVMRLEDNYGVSVTLRSEFVSRFTLQKNPVIASYSYQAEPAAAYAQVYTIATTAHAEALAVSLFYQTNPFDPMKPKK